MTNLHYSEKTATPKVIVKPVWQKHLGIVIEVLSGLHGAPSKDFKLGENTFQW